MTRARRSSAPILAFVLAACGAEARHLRTVGSNGEGPGEFRYLRDLHRLGGDSVLADDGALGRVSVFDAQGRFVRSSRIRSLVGPLPDGTLIQAQAVRPRDPGETGYARNPIAYIRYTVDGVELDTVATLPGTEYFRIGEGDERRLSVFNFAAPFNRVRLNVVAGGRLYTGAGDSYEVAVYRPDGRLERLVRSAQPNLPVTPEDIEQYKEKLLERVPNENMRRRLGRLAADAPFPETMPAYASLRVDTEGNLWVQEYRRPGDEQPRWSIFDADGRWLGTVETPQGLSINDIGADYVLGTRRDDMDVEHVRLYGLVK